MAEALLSVEQLKVSLTRSGTPLVRDVAFTLDENEALAIVGESGSGKSVTAKALVGLTRTMQMTATGTVLYRGQDLMSASDRELQGLRGRRIAMVLQDAMTALNPVTRIGPQIVEAIRAHREVSRPEATARAIELLREVGIASPERRVNAYPHQLSGGMRQRALIAVALACDPDILIADEPTTALDVTVQAQVLDLIESVTRARGAGLILITHDLGVVAEVADRVVVMYAGEIVETGMTAQIFEDPHHPYTQGLLRSSPRADRPAQRRMLTIPGTPATASSDIVGCRFRPRCAAAFDRCADRPSLERRAGLPGHSDRCWLSTSAKRALAIDHAAPVLDGEVQDA
jgi:peptide/nickel transport system ATP-binding protein